MTRRIIFITGGAGFVGSNVAATLAQDPTLDIVVCDRLGAADSGKWRNIAKHPIGDIVAPEAMFDWLEKRWREVEVVVHLASSTGADTDADAVVDANFTLARDLYRWSTDRQRRLIYASTAATYGDGAHGFDDRMDLDYLASLRPANVYAWSKALFDLFAARQAAREYAPPQWVGLKLFNAYGPNEGHKASAKSIAAQIWPQVARGHAVQLFRSHNPDYPDGGQLRDFIYVKDVADVVRWLVDNPQVSGLYNLGSGQARSFADMAQAVFKAAGRPARIDYIDMPSAIRARYQYRSEAAMERLRAAGYAAPFTSLEDGVADYVGRYLSQADPHR